MSDLHLAHRALQRVERGEFVASVPDNHHLASKTVVSIADLIDERLIGIDPNDPYEAILARPMTDAGATIERAKALGAKVFEQPVGPGELQIPAIRGVGGGIPHFIDQSSDLARVWETEFVTTGADGGPAPSAGLTSFDHIAQTMDYGEMLTWLLDYTSICATGKTPMVDVSDPAGLVRSQAIENADGSLRISLNGAENRRTLAGHFIAENFGSAVQHVAFVTSDIFATATALRAQKFKPLSISPNYYDDLAARFELAPELLQRLRDDNILYDQDD